MKNNLFLFVSLSLLFTANAFCDSLFRVNENVTKIDNNTIHFENTSFQYIYDFIGDNKVVCYIIYNDEERMIKEHTLELKSEAGNSAMLHIFDGHDSLQESYQITFMSKNKVSINRDTYILRNDSYEELQRNVLRDEQIKELLEFLKTTLFFYNDFHYFDFLVFAEPTVKYFIISASLHFSSGQSAWIYDYEAQYTYKDDLVETLIIVDEDDDVYLEKKLEEKTDDHLVYKLFKRISEGCSTRSHFFIDLEHTMTQESGVYYRSCYEYPYLKSWYILQNKNDEIDE